MSVSIESLPENLSIMRSKQFRKWDGQELRMVSFFPLQRRSRNLSSQQNLPQFDIAVIVLQAPSNRLTDLKPLAIEILAVLDTAIKGQAMVISA